MTNHDPEMGRASGAVMNVILRSGTNDFTAAAYEFLQNSDFNARSFFNPSVGHLAYNYVGGNVGGPIKKNKIFIFGDYLRVMDHEANTNHDDDSAQPVAHGRPERRANNDLRPEHGQSAGRHRPHTVPGQQIPANRINPISTKILDLLPPTNESYNINQPSNNYFALLPFTKTTDSFDAKLDYNITDKDRLSGRFSFSRPVIFQAPLFGIAGGDGAGERSWAPGTQKTYSSGLNYDRIVSPTLVADVRLAVRIITTRRSRPTTARTTPRTWEFPASTSASSPAASWASRSTTDSPTR